MHVMLASMAFFVLSVDFFVRQLARLSRLHERIPDFDPPRSDDYLIPFSCYHNWFQDSNTRNLRNRSFYYLPKLPNRVVSRQVDSRSKNGPRFLSSQPDRLRRRILQQKITACLNAVSPVVTLEMDAFQGIFHDRIGFPASGQFLEEHRSIFRLEPIGKGFSCNLFLNNN